MIKKEQRKLEDIRGRALDYLEHGKYQAMERELKKLDRSFMISEATEIRIELECLLHLRRGELEDACSLVRENLGYLWASPFSWMISRQLNKAVSSLSRKFRLSVTGSGISLGAFSYFSSDYIATFDVVASSPSDALLYLKSMLDFEEPNSVKIVATEEYSKVPKSVLHEGVLHAYPFVQAERAA